MSTEEIIKERIIAEEKMSTILSDFLIKIQAKSSKNQGIIFDGISHYRSMGSSIRINIKISL
jgi:hypothetical protein